MSALQLIYAPHPIFKQKAQPVNTVTDEIITLVNDMSALLEMEGAVGLGANMVGILKRIIIVDLKTGDTGNPHIFINPEITWASEETQTFEEASLSFPGISAKITRPSAIELNFIDIEGHPQNFKANGYLATVIQHEIDYLNGIVFLDHLSHMKRSLLFKKMQKYLKQNPPHIHSENCNH